MKLIMESWQLVLNEALYYDDNGVLKGPIAVNKVVEDIVKFIKRKYPDYNEKNLNFEFKGGKRTLQFTNFGSLKSRDELIRDLEHKGWVSVTDKMYKRSKMYHRAQTKFVDVLKNKQIPVVIQLNAGGGAAASGESYEREMEKLLNSEFINSGKLYFAEKQGGSTNNPDIVIWADKNKIKKFVSLEAKTTIGSDFGQFQLSHDPSAQTFLQKTQTSSKELKNLFDAIVNYINSHCPIPAGQQSGELLKMGSAQLEEINFIKPLGEVVEDYYKEKSVDYIVVSDAVYSTGTPAANKSIPKFSDSVSGGYVRIRRKCHGKSYSTTAAIKFGSIETSINYYDVLNQMFP